MGAHKELMYSCLQNKGFIELSFVFFVLCFGAANKDLFFLRIDVTSTVCSHLGGSSRCNTLFWLFLSLFSLWEERLTDWKISAHSG